MRKVFAIVLTLSLLVFTCGCSQSPLPEAEAAHTGVSENSHTPEDQESTTMEPTEVTSTPITPTETEDSNQSSDESYAFITSITEWACRYNEKCSEEQNDESIDTQNIASYIDDSGIFRYPIADWITLIIYPAEDTGAIKTVSLRFDPTGRKGAWILQVFSFSELLLEVTYPNIDNNQANAVTTYYEDTLYSGSWNWPEKGTVGVYAKNGIACDLYRAINSLIFVVTP